MADRNTVYIYIFGMEDGPSKVGYSIDTARRVKQIQAEHGEKITVTGKWPVGARIALGVERYVHWLLRDYHYSGEWFSAPYDVIAEAIQKALAGEVDMSHLIPRIDIVARGWNQAEYIGTKYPRGTRERFRALLDKRHHGEFVRAAVLSELARRERS